MNEAMYKMNCNEMVDTIFRHTSADGSVLLPVEINLAGETEAYRFRISWNENDVKRVKVECARFIGKIREISDLGVGANSACEEAREKFSTRPALYSFWRTYIRELHSAVDGDFREISDIVDRYESMETLRELAGKVVRGESLSEDESELLSDLAAVRITEEEKDKYHAYAAALRTEANRRIPDARLGAYELIIHSARLCMVYALNPPEVIIPYYENRVVMDYVLANYGISAKATGNLMEDFSTAVVPDDSGRIVKSNSRKSLAPFFVAEILKEKTDEFHPMTREALCRAVNAYPYELSMERKALSRVVETLVQEQFGFHKCRKGIYFEKGNR